MCTYKAIMAHTLENHPDERQRILHLCAEYGLDVCAQFLPGDPRGPVIVITDSYATNRGQVEGFIGSVDSEARVFTEGVLCVGYLRRRLLPSGSTVGTWEPPELSRRAVQILNQNSQVVGELNEAQKRIRFEEWQLQNLTPWQRLLRRRDDSLDQRLVEAFEQERHVLEQWKQMGMHRAALFVGTAVTEFQRKQTEEDPRALIMVASNWWFGSELVSRGLRDEGIPHIILESASPEPTENRG